LQRQGILLYLSLPPNEAKPWNPDAMRDMISPKKIGHYGMGDTEYLLRKADQLEEAKALITQAYERVH
jgi:predicted transport protein